MKTIEYDLLSQKEQQSPAIILNSGSIYSIDASLDTSWLDNISGKIIEDAVKKFEERMKGGNSWDR
jgi:hypothetical protein